MRRSDREITDSNQIRSILETCKVCRLAMVDNEGAYIVPLNFGYRVEEGAEPCAARPFGLTLYCHGASEGRKIRAMQGNARVCFEMDCETELMGGAQMSDYTYHYKSIIGSGTVRFLTDDTERMDAMITLMECQTGMSRAEIAAMPYEAQYMKPRAMAMMAIDVVEFAAKYHK